VEERGAHLDDALTSKAEDSVTSPATFLATGAENESARQQGLNVVTNPANPITMFHYLPLPPFGCLPVVSPCYDLLFVFSISFGGLKIESSKFACCEAFKLNPQL
jgi:hypothetical protein